MIAQLSMAKRDVMQLIDKNINAFEAGHFKALDYLCWKFTDSIYSKVCILRTESYKPDVDGQLIRSYLFFSKKTLLKPAIDGLDAQLETAVCRSPTLSLKAAVNYSNCTILQITLDLSFNIWIAKNLQISFVTVVKYTKMAKIFAFSQVHQIPGF